MSLSAMSVDRIVLEKLPKFVKLHQLDSLGESFPRGAFGSLHLGGDQTSHRLAHFGLGSK